MSPNVTATLIEDDAVHVMVKENGKDVMRLYVREPDADALLTPAQAGHWSDTVRKCGGTVHRTGPVKR